MNTCRKDGQRSEKFLATNDQFIKDKPKLMHGFMRVLLKALRLVKQNREIAMDAMMKFSEADRDSPLAERNEAVEPFDRLRTGFWNDWNV